MTEEAMQVHGEIDNIKTYLQEQLRALYELSVPAAQLSTHELNRRMLDITAILGREVAVYINRQGKVAEVSVGDAGTVELPEFKSRSERRLSGIRCIHTHPSGDVLLSAPDISSLRRLRFDVMAAIGIQEGEIVGTMGFFTGETEPDGTEEIQCFGPVREKILHGVSMVRLVTAINKKLGRYRMKNTEGEEERAILAGLEGIGRGAADGESMAELARLAETAGATVAGRFTQRKERPDAAFFLGKGKIEEIGLAVQNLDADVLILDDEITPSQQRNLEQSLGIKVVDRTALILDIFAQRARSREGKLQVELAQLKYRLPRLGGQGILLSRLGGGIGTRGPGETKLEVDRRRIRNKIHDIERQIEDMRRSRKLHRSRRKESRIPMAALVGYTNAGKSTLLNALTGADAYVEDQLFATLDPTTRRLSLSHDQEILLTDTVGFIQKLPHTLVNAFRATLEEVQEADLLIHVVDCSNREAEHQIASVIEVLKELKAETKPTLYVFNKADCLGDEKKREQFLRGREGIFVSARDGWNLQGLREKIETFFLDARVSMKLLVPFHEGRVVTLLHDLKAIRSTEYTEEGVRIEVLLPGSRKDAFMKYRIEEKDS